MSEDRRSQGMYRSVMGKLSLRVGLLMGLLLGLSLLLLVGCGGQDSSEGFENENINNPLVGDWRRIRTCDEYVSEEKQAGFAYEIGSHQDLLAEFGAGNGDQGSQDSDGLCQGV